jgi:hypothetical protein
MPEYRHPRADPETDAAWAADLGDGTVVSVDSDGVFTAESDAAVRQLAAAYDTTPDALRLNQQTGDEDPAVLVKDGVCPWCDEYEGDHVGQHASSAHPDEWDAFKSD